MVSSVRKADWVLISILSVGVMLRLLLFFSNPPNNAYDDHLEPIAYYLNHHQRPAPNACWECYQPPLYYVIAAGVYQVAYSLTHTYFTAWKAVQAINTLLSIGVLMITYQIVRGVFISQQRLVWALIAVASIFPRDLYASAMITNDYLLVFLATLSIWFFLRYVRKQHSMTLAGLCLSTAACALTKQHGLIVMLLPVSILAHHILSAYNQKVRSYSVPVIVLPLLAIGLGISEEVWKFRVTNILLVSNQHYFDYASNQPPGNISKIGFHSLQLITLLQFPLLNSATWSSYWTVLFGGTWFDYEYRYVTPQLQGIRGIAGTLYIYGAIILSLATVGALKLLRQISKQYCYLHWEKVVLALVAISFFLVPLVQTIRLPYYSSMKSQFMLPASSLFLLLLGYALQNVKVLKTPVVQYGLIGLTLLIGISHLLYVVIHLPSSLSALSGPLWQFPHLNF